MPVSALRRFEKFFDATSDCQFYVKQGPDGRFRYVHVNPAALSVTGRKQEAELVGLTPLEALGDDYGTTVEQNIMAAYRSGATHHYRGSLSREGGPPFYDAFYFPLHDDEGKVAGILGSARDISEINTLTEKAIHNEKIETLGTVASGIVHDFRNILTAFQAVLRLLQDRNMDEDRRKLVLDEGHRTLANGTALTDRLTAFARRERIKAIPHDMAQLLNECRPIVERVLGRTISLTIECPEDLWQACCDRSEFEIALVNLATNARDAMDGPGSIWISAKNARIRDDETPSFPREAVVVTFRDDGCGMDRETAGKAVDPFFTTKPEGKGTGLGLSGIARFAQGIGGALQIDSEPGAGTAISIYFPRADA
jgi:PAS domain S-box-containing protein